MKNFFYPKVTYYTVVAFTSLFNEMTVWGYDKNGNAVKQIPVAVKLAYKEKIIAAIQGGNVSTPYKQYDYENSLPLISIEWSGFVLDRARLAGVHQTRRLYVEYVDTDPAKLAKTVQHIDLKPTPYLLKFKLVVWAGYIDQLMQIVENIIPYFFDDCYVSIYDRGTGSERKIKVKMGDAASKMTAELKPEQIRSDVLMVEFEFTCEANYYRPEEPVGKPIKSIFLQYGAISTKQGESHIEPDNVGVVTATTPVSAVTSGASGLNYCYYDLETNLLEYIRSFSMDESEFIKSYDSVINGNCSPIATPLSPPIPPEVANPNLGII